MFGVILFIIMFILYAVGLVSESEFQGYLTRDAIYHSANTLNESMYEIDSRAESRHAAAMSEVRDFLCSNVQQSELNHKRNTRGKQKERRRVVKDKSGRVLYEEVIVKYQEGIL
ncbi:MAG: hypothetical protein NC041_03620 [Bacteroides sp.]|nr:hypothetical protein [Prevotella sp.]MCM1408213.1 hypothetical protein [Treponema brennaborense]MCM1469537.1 hypothetical protein [Bacteroides sp.]